jgi:hypothetical protein
VEGDPETPPSAIKQGPDVRISEHGSSAQVEPLSYQGDDGVRPETPASGLGCTITTFALVGLGVAGVVFLLVTASLVGIDRAFPMVVCFLVLLFASLVALHRTARWSAGDRPNRSPFVRSPVRAFVVIFALIAMLLAGLVVLLTMY